MITDRVATSSLMMAICTFDTYATYVPVFQALMCLDVSAHWVHMYSQCLPGLTPGASTGPAHHKAINLDENPILHFYYKQSVLFFFRSFNELFFMSVYLLHFFKEGDQYHEVFWWCGAFSTPWMVIKQLFSVVHLVTAAYNVALY